MPPPSPVELTLVARANQGEEAETFIYLFGKFPGFVLTTNLRGFRRAVTTAKWLVPIAAAAALLVAVVPELLPTSRAPGVAAQPADINGDGVVDIIDALLLAQAVEHKRDTLPIWDLNHDQQIDNRDVEQIAIAAVRLQEEQP